MYNTIEFQKFVDIIDECIMQLFLLKKEHRFPNLLKDELLNILEFLNKTKEDQLDEVLHDKRISIDVSDLKKVVDKFHQLNIKDLNIKKLASIVDKIGNKELKTEEIDLLESTLINLSRPLWQTVISEKSYE